MNGFSQTISGISTQGTGTRNAVIGGSTTSTSVLQIDIEAPQTYDGALGGTGSATGTSDTGANNNLSLIKDGTGLLLLGGTNTYTGQTSVSRGTLALGHVRALGAGGHITLGGGTGASATVVDGNFILNGLIITDHGGGYTEAPTVSISGGSASATAHVTSLHLAGDTSVGGTGDLVVDPVVSGSYGLTKTGTGSTTLAAANTYTGGTTVEAGTLLTTNTTGSATGSGSVLVKSGATFGGSGIVGLAPDSSDPFFPNIEITLQSGAHLMIGTTHNVNAAADGRAAVLTLQSGGDGQFVSGY